ncbi:hypothetical protein C2845_PM13G22030 [Panicum miliaceum]|uniref:DUF1618 domain-containing protein n=1 Tax=Panicum miliaceum TaxID=4540 RepID=A0A3L6RIW7_PANMI|nr:hypothetical protein C2845_PM13G22030 [Panicum miliaceum]
MSPSIESTIGFSRRFLNLIVGNRIPGVKSLCCFDLTDQQLFYPEIPPQSQGSGLTQRKKQMAFSALMMESIGIPRSSFNFRASARNDQWKIDCFPLAEREVICADQSGRAFLFDAKTHQAQTMPSLHKPKSLPFTVFVPNANADNDYDHNGYGSTLFVMERIPKPEVGCRAQYSLRLPQAHRGKGVGTYCLDTASHTWSEVGKWTLPFHGRVEYVPELKLWFGLSGEARHLAAADLSSMDSEPQLVGPWKEHCLPEEWKECKDSQLVNLGSGRFCITRFFHTRIHNCDFGDESIAVFTGVEVVPHVRDFNGDANKGGNGKVELQMTPHKSKCHTYNGSTIDAVF